jgi:hypothetical protein
LRDQKDIRLRLPLDLYSRLLAKAKKEGVSMNTTMVSLLTAGTGEPPDQRRQALLAAVGAAGLDQQLGDSVRKWDGHDLRLYPIRGGASASAEIAERQAEENERLKPWGVVIGARSFLLGRVDGVRLDRELASKKISYIRHRGRGRPAG